MKYLLDTCVISELVKPVPNPGVVEWLKKIPSESLFLCVITMGEIHKGLTRLPDSKKKEKLTHWANTLLDEYKGKMIPIDLNIAENWGVIQGKAEKAGIAMSSLYSLIAAAAYTYNLTLVTRNEKDFTPGSIPILNPWKKGTPEE